MSGACNAKSIRMERESEEQCSWHRFYVPTVGKDAVIGRVHDARDSLWN